MFIAAFLNLLTLEEPLKYFSGLGEPLHIQAQIQDRSYKIIIFVSCVDLYICINGVLKLKIKNEAYLFNVKLSKSEIFFKINRDLPGNPW